MRWILIGERAHAVLRKNNGKTLCGLELARAERIVAGAPFEPDRCGNCDNEWRRRGRLHKPHVNKKRDLTVYRPRHKFEEWENAS